MSLSEIKKLRELTSLGVNDCKEALGKAKGDLEEALKILRQKGVQMLQKRSQRAVGQGLIEAYVHFGGNLGVLLEVNCETDFVARTDLFKRFVKDVAMQIAATAPTYLKREDISQEVLADLANLDEYSKEHCLLEQPFIKDNKISVGDYLKQVVAQTGENVVIKRFIRFSLGEEK